MNIRNRLLVSAICAVALAATGVSLERTGPRPVSAGAPEQAISGEWSCPHGGGEGWKVWVTVTNPGEEPVEVRMSTSAGGAAPPPTNTLIEPQTLRYFEVSAPLPGSATIVEYLGGTVVAGAVTAPPTGGLAAMPCAGDPGNLWYLPESSTLRGETAYLVVHNPFAAQAVVDVILTAGDRRIRNGRLQGVVLGALDARAFELNNFALGVDALSATVEAPQGRVAVASVVVTEGAIRSSLGVAAPSTRWMLPGAGAETEMVIRALNEDAAVSGELQLADGALPAIDLEAVSAATAESFGIQLADGGFLVEADGERPMVAGRRMFLEAQAPASPPPQQEEEPAGGGKGQGGGGGGGPAAQGDRGGSNAKQGDEKKGAGKGQKEEPPPPPPSDPAATEGAPEPHDLWLVQPAIPPEGGPSALLLQNPGDEEIEVTVALLGAGGPEGSDSSVTIPPRSIARFPIPGDRPVAALVRGAGVVAGAASTVPGAFSVLLGLPI
jgi:P pilus assembly chaperone PapD